MTRRIKRVAALILILLAMKEDPTNPHAEV